MGTTELTCPECEYEYETENGDGGCPRCAEYEELQGQVHKILADLRPTHLEQDEIKEAIDDGVERYLRARLGIHKTAGQSPAQTDTGANP